MKTTVIFHSADFDGIFCREIAKKFLGTENVDYIGWNFGDPKIPMPPDGIVYIMDLSPECLDWPFATGLGKERMIWIDHHKTSIEKFPQDIPGYRIDGVAACRLGWQWFNWPKNALHPPAIRDVGLSLPEKRHFVDREVSEPLAVRLAGEYDIWRKDDPRAERLQYGLRCVELDDRWWDALMRPDEDEVARYGLKVLLEKGEAAQEYAKRVDASICKSRTWLMEWEGLKFLCVNSARFNSLFFAAKDVPETGHDALLGFCYDGKCWTVSLYHAKHRTDLDLSEIAKKHSGGGHKGACGFTCKTLPFSL